MKVEFDWMIPRLKWLFFDRAIWLAVWKASWAEWISVKQPVEPTEFEAKFSHLSRVNFSETATWAEFPSLDTLSLSPLNPSYLAWIPMSVSTVRAFKRVNRELKITISLSLQRCGYENSRFLKRLDVELILRTRTEYDLGVSRRTPHPWQWLSSSWRALCMWRHHESRSPRTLWALHGFPRR